MEKYRRKFGYISIGLLAAFLAWTILVSFVDVQPIGPQETYVGFATLNQFIHSTTGVHMELYNITDWLGLVPLAFVMCFAIFGLVQWIRRKSICKVDYDILILGGFYLVVFAVYAIFEVYVVNFRPVLIEGILEASYPSSTTMLVLCVMPTAMLVLNTHIKRRILKLALDLIIIIFIIFMVWGRLISGVHWITDIIGGVLLSAALVSTYCFFVSIKKTQKP